MDEFALINRYFKKDNVSGNGVQIGIGDDAAIIRPPPGTDLAVTVDTLHEGVHFPTGTDAFDVGYKSVAVNLSDLAAMGAEPAWATLSLTLPRVDQAWLEGFSRGLFELLDRYEVALVGGDTCRGPLSITVQAGGWIGAQNVLRRGGARLGDDLYVTGTLGDGALGLKIETGRYTPSDSDRQWLLARLRRPEPRVGAGRALRGLANAAIDLSDGLAGDLGHILESSSLPGAVVTVADLPLSAAVRRYVDRAGDLDPVVAGGDDYELCFTASPDAAPRVQAAERAAGVPMTKVGTITGHGGVELRAPTGRRQRLAPRGFSHFESHG